MRVTGSHELAFPRERVWQGLADRDALTVAVPDCEGVEAGPPLSVTAPWRVAALDGVYVARLEVLDAVAPSSATLRLVARGGPGTLTATVRATLHDRDGGTRLDWEAECEAGGHVAAVGGRVLEAALARLAASVLAGLERALAGQAGPTRPRVGAEPGAGAAVGAEPGIAAAGAGAGAAPVGATAVPREWGPLQDGPAPERVRLAGAALAGALGALLAVWLAGRLRGRG